MCVISTLFDLRPEINTVETLDVFQKIFGRVIFIVVKREQEVNRVIREVRRSSKELSLPSSCVAQPHAG